MSCCILETHSHRRCNNNITDVTQEVMLHMQPDWSGHVINARRTCSRELRTVLTIICVCVFTVSYQSKLMHFILQNEHTLYIPDGFSPIFFFFYLQICLKWSISIYIYFDTPMRRSTALSLSHNLFAKSSDK